MLKTGYEHLRPKWIGVVPTSASPRKDMTVLSSGPAAPEKGDARLPPDARKDRFNGHRDQVGRERATKGIALACEGRLRWL